MLFKDFCSLTYKNSKTNFLCFTIKYSLKGYSNNCYLILFPSLLATFIKIIHPKFVHSLSFHYQLIIIIFLKH